jgi:integrase
VAAVGVGVTQCRQSGALANLACRKHPTCRPATANDRPESCCGALRPQPNPAGRTKFPPPRPTSHTHLTTPEVAALVQACGAQDDVVALLAFTGLRFGELVGGKSVEGNPKSATGRRSVPIPQR